MSVPDMSMAARVPVAVENTLAVPTFGGGAEQWSPNRSNNYPKLALLVHSVEAKLARAKFHRHMGRREVAAIAEDNVAVVDTVLSAIETFALRSRAHWLKIAAACKADVIEHAASGSCGLAAVEFGAFVGYTALRLARAWGVGRTYRTVVSIEVDPIHAVVSRHLLDLGALALGAEVWTGQAKDVVLRFCAELGEYSGGFAFMDHCGTSFQDDLCRLRRLRSLPREAAVLADNVLEPGAPIFAWRVVAAAQRPASCWALREFGSPATEDWMVLANSLDVHSRSR